MPIACLSAKFIVAGWGAPAAAAVKAVAAKPPHPTPNDMAGLIFLKLASGTDGTKPFFP